MKNSLIALILASIFTSCSKDINHKTSENIDHNIELPDLSTPTTSYQYGDLIINSFCATGQHYNEFGDAADWIELVNNTSEPIVIKEYTWSITDNLEKIEKFYLPEQTIEANESVIIWCDKEEDEGNDIHSNFKLSSKGEYIGVYWNNELINSIEYDSVLDITASHCRINVDSEQWTTTTEVVQAAQ